MAMQDSDNLIVGRGNASYKISYAEFVAGLEPPEPPIDPVQVGKGVITPTVDVYVGDTLTGSATVTDAVNPVETHVWELDGTEDQRGSSATYTAKEGVIRYRKEVTDDNNQSPVIGDWSEPVTATEPPVVEPTMSGLRFDRNRQTNLNTTLENTTDSPWTLSVWSKYTGGSSGVYYIAQQRDGGGQINLYVQDGQYGTTSLYPAGAANTNTWEHLVLTWDGSIRSLYVNGELRGTSPAGSNTGAAGFYIGSSNDGTANFFDGYLSDYYFVDNKVLEPTLFATSVNGKWKPLDSTVVKQNIDAAERKQPYDSRANTDQVWRAQVTPADANTAKAFNGNMVEGAVSTPFSWSPNLFDVQTLEIYTQASSLNPATYSTLTINGEDKTADLKSGNGWNTISNPPSNLVSLEATYVSSSEKIDIYGIKVNGRLLVDDGVWDNSQNWSDGSFSSGGVDNMKNGFDGDTTTAAVTTGTSQFNFNTPYTGVTKVELSCSATTYIITETGNHECTNLPNSWSSSTGWVDVTSNITGSEIRGFVFASDQIKFAGIRINDTILVDAGDQWDTTQIWSNNLVSSTGNWYAPDYDNTAAFNGKSNYEVGSYASTPDGSNLSITLDLSGNPLTYSDKVEIYNAPFEQEFSVNDGGFTSTGSTEGWLTVAQGGGTLSKLEMRRSSGACVIAGYRVDGKLLIDGYGPGFGNNGFYLPFDPEQDGATYMEDTISGSPKIREGDYGPNRAFDGDLLNRCQSEPIGNTVTQSSLTWTPKTPIPATSFRFFGLCQDDSFGTWEYSVNGGAFTREGEGGPSYTWHDATSQITGGQITSFTVRATYKSGGSAGGVIGALEVDGKLLIEHTSIGVDMSGNGNNFYDQSFVPSTITDPTKRKDWVSEGTWNWNANGTDQGDSQIEGKEKLFNSVPNSYPSAPNGNPGNIRYTPNTPITWTNRLELYCFIDSDGAATRDVYVKPVGGARSSVRSFAGNVPQGRWIDVTSLMGNAAVEYVEWGNYAGSDGNRTPNGFGGFRVDGVILQMSTPTDQVTDTPMKSYAILNEGENGNLVATANTTGNISYPGEAGTIYYYERDGVAQTGTGPISGLAARPNASSPWHKYNFGQLPWEGVGPQGSEQELYQTWDQYARTQIGYAIDRIAKLEQRNSELEALVAEARTRLAALELNEISDDAVDTALITLIGSINDRLSVLENN